METYDNGNTSRATSLIDEKRNNNKDDDAYYHSQYDATTTNTTQHPQQQQTPGCWETTWHYPLIAVGYLIASPSLVCNTVCTVLWGILISITILIVLFVTTLYEQAQLLGGGRWWSWIFAVFLVLLEATVLTLIVLKVSHVKSQKRIFVETMKLENTWDASRMIEPGPDIPCSGCCSFSTILQIITYPLHVFIPILGTFVFSFLNGKFAGLDWMNLYSTVLGGFTVEEFELAAGVAKSSSSSCFEFSNPYTQFGFVCQLLESIPIAGPSFFVLSNACATALWASDVERLKKQQPSSNPQYPQQRPPSSSQQYNNKFVNKYYQGKSTK